MIKRHTKEWLSDSDPVCPECGSGAIMMREKDLNYECFDCHNLDFSRLKCELVFDLNDNPKWKYSVLKEK